MFTASFIPGIFLHDDVIIIFSFRLPWFISFINIRLQFYQIDNSYDSFQKWEGLFCRTTLFKFTYITYRSISCDSYYLLRYVFIESVRTSKIKPLQNHETNNELKVWKKFSKCYFRKNKMEKWKESNKYFLKLSRKLLKLSFKVDLSLWCELGH